MQSRVRKPRTDFYHINRLKEKTHIWLGKDAERAFDESYTFL